MSAIRTIPRRLVECGGAVEDTGSLWHITRDGATTCCGETCCDWPRVANAVERAGIWCGRCFVAVANAGGEA